MEVHSHFRFTRKYEANQRVNTARVSCHMNRFIISSFGNYFVARQQAVRKRKRPHKAGVSRLNQLRNVLLLLEVVVAGFARAAYDAELLFEAGFVTR